MNNIFYVKIIDYGKIYNNRTNLCLPFCLKYGLKEIKREYTIDNIINKLGLQYKNIENINEYNMINICNIYNISINIYSNILYIKNNIVKIDNNTINSYTINTPQIVNNIINLVFYNNNFYLIENNITEEEVNFLLLKNSSEQLQYKNNLLNEECNLKLLNFKNLYKDDVDIHKLNLNLYNNTINDIDNKIKKIYNNLNNLNEIKETKINKYLIEKSLFIDFVIQSIHNIVNL
jgi:hypothetical protein